MIEKDIQMMLGISERVKAQRYKGRKIPGKYLTKNPDKMKKEIDTYRGKKEYKKDWNADYKSGKGGEENLADEAEDPGGPDGQHDAGGALGAQLASKMERAFFGSTALMGERT